MTKNEIIMKVAEKTDLPKAYCEVVIDAFTNEIQSCLVNGDKIIFKGFMSFEVCELQERAGRNPKTGEITTFPATKYVKCRPSKALKEAVNAQKGGLES